MEAFATSTRQWLAFSHVLLALGNKPTKTGFVGIILRILICNASQARTTLTKMNSLKYFCKVL